MLYFMVWGVSKALPEVINFLRIKVLIRLI